MTAKNSDLCRGDRIRPWFRVRLLSFNTAEANARSVAPTRCPELAPLAAAFVKAAQRPRPEIETEPIEKFSQIKTSYHMLGA